MSDSRKRRNFFFFTTTSTPAIYTLSLHDALPILAPYRVAGLLRITWEEQTPPRPLPPRLDRKSTRLNSSHANISYAVFCLKKKNDTQRGDPARDHALRNVMGLGVDSRLLRFASSR